MINYKRILVFENDLEHQGLPRQLKTLLNKEDVSYDVWYNFNYSFYRSAEENFKHLSELPEDTLVVTEPSFVGADNQFSRYINLFLKLKELNIKLNIAILYSSDFFVYLLKHLSIETRYMKKEVNHKQLKEILDFHSIYKIESDIGTSILIDYDKLLESYFETHRKLGKTKVRVKATGEIYNVQYIYYGDNFDSIHLTLEIENDYNNSFKLNEIEKL